MKYLVGRDFAFPDYLPRYARVFEFDVLFMRLDVEIDLERQLVEGTVRYRIRLKKDGARVELDAVEMDILEVSQDYYYDGQKLEIRPQWRGEGEVAIRYRARPRSGMYFIKPNAARRSYFVWTQGESEYNRYWVPLPDSPNIKFPWAVAVTVPKPYVAGSNGVLIEVKDLGDRQTFVWEMRHPMSPYLLAIAVGDYRVEREECDGVVLEYYIPRYVGDEWRYSFYNTCKIMKFFSEYLLPYPYGRYAQVVVPEFIYGGMENTTFTILTDWTIHDKHAHCPYSGFPCPEVEDFSSDPLVAHEMAHMWFGDLVTAKDWGHIAINESFATFIEALWTERHQGRDAYLYEIYTNFKTYLGEYSRRYSRPIVTNLYKIPDEVFDRHAYEKGSVVLHMLRELLGDEAFRKGLRLFLERHKYRAVDIDDLRKAMEEASGQDLEWFWRQFFYSAGHPALKVSWSYSDGGLKIQIRQSQGEDSYPQYTFPLEIKVVYEDGRKEVRKIMLSEKEAALYMPSGKPRYVCIDPHFKVMKALELQYPLESAVAMLEDGDMYCRIQAVEVLKKNGSVKAVEALGRALQDRFWGVAVEAARALGEVGTGEAVARLVDVYHKAIHPRVRRAIVEALGNARRKEAAEFLDKILHDVGESYYVRAEAARALGKARWEFAEHSLKKALEYQSHLDVIKRGAIEGLAELGTEGALGVALRHVESQLPTYVRATAVQSLAKFGPRKEVLDAVRRALRDDNFRVRYAALTAALELLEPRLVSDLQERAEIDLDGRVRRVAREIVEKTKRFMDRGAEYQKLREEVEKLRDEYRRLLDRIARLER